MEKQKTECPVCEGPKSTYSKRCRTCFEVRSRDCPCGSRKDPNAATCRACYDTDRTPDKVCPDCAGPKTGRAKRCKPCSARAEPRGFAARIDSKRDRSTNAHGYVMVRVGPEHPRAKKAGWAAEHTVIMERHIGRFLVAGETVHHRNGVRDDNRIENLELWAKPQPMGVRAIDLLEWARSVVERYEPIEAELRSRGASAMASRIDLD